MAAIYIAPTLLDVAEVVNAMPTFNSSVSAMIGN